MKRILFSSLLLAIVTTQAQSWTAQNSAFPTAGTYPTILSLSDANTVWAVGADGSGLGAEYQQFSRTSDGGLTWTAGNIDVGGSANQIADLSAPSATTAYVAYITGGSAKGGVYKTTNGGTSWSKISNSPTTMFNDASSFPNIVQFWDVNTGVVGGDPVGGYFELYTTINGGTSWTRVPSANLPAPLSGEYGYTTIDGVAGDNYWFGTNKGRIYKSANKGLNWTVVQSPISDFGTAAQSGTFAIKDANNAWLIDRTAAFLYGTTDGGVNWDPIDSNGIFYTGDLIYVPGTEQTLISSGASSSSRGSSISTDGGLNWTEITPADGDTDGITALASSGIDAVYGGGFTTSSTVGGMNKLSASLATNETSKASVSIYPNPTSNYVNIMAKDKIRNIEIIDLTGKSSSRNISSTNKVDMTSYTAGVYIVKVNFENGKSTATKVIKK